MAERPCRLGCEPLSVLPRPPLLFQSADPVGLAVDIPPHDGLAVCLSPLQANPALCIHAEAFGLAGLLFSWYTPQPDSSMDESLGKCVDDRLIGLHEGLYPGREKSLAPYLRRLGRAQGGKAGRGRLNIQAQTPRIPGTV